MLTRWFWECSTRDTARNSGTRLSTRPLAYETRKNADQEGERPLHRPREWKREEREQEKARKRSNWYKKGGNGAVIFVPAITTEFTATEEIPKRNKATRFQNQSGRKSWCCDQKVTPEV